MTTGVISWVIVAFVSPARLRSAIITDCPKPNRFGLSTERQKGMTGSATEDAEIDELAAALDAILTELVEYRLSRPGNPECLRLVAIPSTERERRAAHFTHIVADPFEGSLLYALRGVGAALHERGGTRLMRTVLLEIAARDPENESRRLSPADRQWDGIGSDDDRWFC
jgi:hypothetical protein